MWAAEFLVLFISIPVSTTKKFDSPKTLKDANLDLNGTPLTQKQKKLEPHEQLDCLWNFK